MTRAAVRLIGLKSIGFRVIETQVDYRSLLNPVMKCVIVFTAVLVICVHQLLDPTGKTLPSNPTPKERGLGWRMDKEKGSSPKDRCMFEWKREEITGKSYDLITSDLNQSK
ncbi:hypothetical protein BY996DRAFT_6410508 [Phakopsora pachyrhizi]|nr:hypothetical protein BY996DRAFT_6410508 [Phakopsora pachyrhizi]